MTNRKSIWSFLGLIFSSFFRWWWVAITGAASLASWLIIPPTGLPLSPLMSGVLMFFVSALLFLTLTTVYQGWMIYQTGFQELRVTAFKRSDCYDGEYLFCLSGLIEVAQGTIIELRRFNDGVELAVALVEIMERNSEGEYQARLIWFSPGHLNQLKTGEYAYADLIAKPLVQLRTIERSNIHTGG